MSKRQYINRFLIIVNYLKRRQASWQDIEAYLQRQSDIEGEDYVISQRTFQRDVIEIRSILNIDIQHNKTTGTYFIADEEEISNNTQLLDSFNLFNALSLTNNYTNFIQFENRVSQGTEHIYGLLYAIKNKLVTEITYHKFYEAEAEKVVVNPCLIKQFKGRWYLLCFKESIGEIRTYGLDRILSIDIKKKKFTLAKNFNPTEYYKHSFGIITPINQKLQKIKFKLNKVQANYVRTYPLHASQKIVEQNERFTIFEIEVYNTYDLQMEFLSFGEEVEILSPKSLINELGKIHKIAQNKLKFFQCF